MVILGVTGVVMSGLLQTTKTETTVQNRTEMHASVRGATELMQQEIGQATRFNATGGQYSDDNCCYRRLSHADFDCGRPQPACLLTKYRRQTPGINQETVQATAIAATPLRQFWVEPR